MATYKSSDKKLGLIRIQNCEHPTRKADVVFVHGLGGNALSTWHPHEKQDEDCWLYWLGRDLPEAGIWSFGYEAEFSELKGKAVPRFDQASALFDLLESHSIGDRPIIFVTHSLGGLIVKEMLRNLSDFPNTQMIDQTKGIVFLATPHTGSHLANLVGLLNCLLRTSVSVEELEAHNPGLRGLNQWYRQSARKLGIDTKVYFETENTKKYGIYYRVVDEDSANPNIQDVMPRAVPGVDHISIAKPSWNSQVYLGVRKFIQDIGQISLQNSSNTPLYLPIKQLEGGEKVSLDLTKDQNP